MENSDTPKRSRKPPQKVVSRFWSKFIEQTPSKVTQVFPPSLYANLLPRINNHKGPQASQNAAASYEAAAQGCRERVAKIVRDCHRTNEKFTDAEFDLESDFQGRWNCLYGLVRDHSASAGGDTETLRDAVNLIIDTDLLGTQSSAAPVNLAALQTILTQSADAPSALPGSVHRVDWIFDDPKFKVDGFSETDVMQGANGDCWWLAALVNLTSVEGVLDKLCVARDEECGVYGFVFHRDGEWVHVVIDDSLYLKYADCDEKYDPSGEKEQKYKQQYQTGSEALHFASSKDKNETWLPLMEKAYAKIHGDYAAIEGGVTQEAIEDLTGGVGTCFQTSRILSKDRLWKQLLNKDKEFLFGLSSSSPDYSDDQSKNGLTLGHAYSVLGATEEVGEDGKTIRLVKIRNPWGRRSWMGFGEWDGPWSDGSKEWSPYWMTKLDHRFGDDGVFWMTYSDMLKKFSTIDRTRLFDKEWHVVQAWTSVSVAWMTGFHQTKFRIKVGTAGPVVIVLSQLDDRYYKGLEGKYTFDLHFILRRSDSAGLEEITRVRGRSPYGTHRSINTEIDLGPGEYEILPKITTQRYDSKYYVEDIITEYAESNPQKLRQIGLNHDIANAKTLLPGNLESLENSAKSEIKKIEGKKEKKRSDEQKFTVTVDIRAKHASMPGADSSQPATDQEAKVAETTPHHTNDKDGTSAKTAADIASTGM